MGLIRLFCATDLAIDRPDKTLFKSDTSVEQVQVSNLTAGDRLDIEFTALQSNPQLSYQSPWSKINPASYSLGIGLYKSDNTQLTYANSFTDDSANYAKLGTLLLDTAPITAEAATLPLPGCKFEILVQLASGSPHRVYRATVTLNKGLITTSSTADIPGQVTATQEWTKALFVPRDGTNPSPGSPVLDEFYVKSQPSGYKIRVWWDDDAEIQSEKF